MSSRSRLEVRRRSTHLADLVFLLRIFTLSIPLSRREGYLQTCLQTANALYYRLACLVIPTGYLEKCTCSALNVNSLKQLYLRHRLLHKRCTYKKVEHRIASSRFLVSSIINYTNIHRDSCSTKISEEMYQ